MPFRLKVCRIQFFTELTTQLWDSLGSRNDGCLAYSRQQSDLNCDCDRPSTADCGVSSFNKKFQKIKYEIDRQNFTIAKLNREIEMKIQRGFPSPCLRTLQSELYAEKKKLKTMIEKAKDEQAQGGCGNDQWESIALSLNDVQRCGNILKPPPTPSDISKVTGFTNLEFCESILTDNECLNSERNKLQEQLCCKDQSVQQLEDKLGSLQCQIVKISHENQKMAKKLEEPNFPSDMKCKIQSITSYTSKLSSNVNQLESNLVAMRKDLQNVKKEKKIAFDFEQQSQTPSRNEMSSKGDCVVNKPGDGRECPKACPCNLNENQSAAKLKCLESQYANLQTEFCRKEKETKELTERMKKCLENCKGDKERAENEALKNRADELVSEISDYKVFIKELQEQVDMYREKFMKGKPKAFTVWLDEC